MKLKLKVQEWFEVFILRLCDSESMPGMMEVPNGWYEVLRVPRPPSVRWPVVSGGQPSQPRRQSRPQSKKLSAQQPTHKSDPVQRPPPMRSCNRSSTRQSQRARSCDQCPRQRRRGSFEVIAGRQSTHVLPVGERLDACHQFIERARKWQAKFRSAAHRSRSGGTHLTSSTEGFGFRIAEDAGK